MARYSVEDLALAAERYWDALGFMAGLWHADEWAFAGAVMLPGLAMVAFGFSRKSMNLLRLVGAPIGGAFIGGFISALGDKLGGCGYSAVLCGLQQPVDELVNTILGLMLAAVIGWIFLPFDLVPKRLGSDGGPDIDFGGDGGDE